MVAFDLLAGTSVFDRLVLLVNRCRDSDENRQSSQRHYHYDDAPHYGEATFGVMCSAVVSRITFCVARPGLERQGVEVMDEIKDSTEHCIAFR